MVLIIDTSKETARVFCVDNGTIVEQREWLCDRHVGTRLLEEIASLVGVKKVTRVAVVAGPGGFSTLRAGVVTASMLAFAWGADLVSISGNSPEELILGALEANLVDTIVPKYDRPGY